MTPQTQNAAVRTRSAADASAEHHQMWQAARDEATLAYLDWRDASYEHKRDAYAAYRAAADREDAAAMSLTGASPSPGTWTPA